MDKKWAEKAFQKVQIWKVSMEGLKILYYVMLSNTEFLRKWLNILKY